MPNGKDSLLLKFRSRDTGYGVTRGTVKAVATELDLTETQVVHIALSRFAQEILPAYEPDDGPLTRKQLDALRRNAKVELAVGKLLDRQHLFE